jgi:hypothetical protein
MDHTRAGSHPLNVARRQTSGASARILVLHLARQHVRYGFETPVRMVRRAFGLSGSNVHWSHLVQ